MTSRLLSIVFLLLVSLSSLRSQSGQGSKNKLSFSYNYGSQSLLSVDYEYRVHLFNIHYYRKFFAKKSWGIDGMLNPQFGEILYKSEPDATIAEVGQEIGLNGGVLLYKNIFKDRLSLYVMLSAGPHFVSGAPSRQSGGFIFADNALAGFLLNVDSHCFLMLGGGIRHISNAKLKYPNGGINTTMVQVGVYVEIE